MNAYQVLYPYAVICMAIVASCVTIIAGGYSFVVMVFRNRTQLLADVQAYARRNNMTPPSQLSTGNILPWVMGGTCLFVASCLAAMLELKIGAWVASIGCQ